MGRRFQAPSGTTRQGCQLFGARIAPRLGQTRSQGGGNFVGGEEMQKKKKVASEKRAQGGEGKRHSTTRTMVYSNLVGQKNESLKKVDLKRPQRGMGEAGGGKGCTGRKPKRKKTARDRESPNQRKKPTEKGLNGLKTHSHFWSCRSGHKRRWEKWQGLAGKGNGKDRGKEKQTRKPEVRHGYGHLLGTAQ